ncbi:hypothetical protein [Deinococcus xianganensis]|uniref:SMI1/KNR4 family protein n=1 Tax=Deinococcus xianganensis TaxID=1507289 RepID=A0A6I4YQ53_9DEIO|nr:hypothetical protein [Deinococcus xianganensis]MXV19665.1 hypothetical protein [Deinococcus xianganensis]
MLLDDLHPVWTYEFIPELQSGPYKRPLTLDDLECLAAFQTVPSDYLALYVEFGSVQFNAEDGYNFDLLTPIDAYDYHFAQGRTEYLPGLFPMTGGASARTLYFGSIDGRTGAYLFEPGVSRASDGIYIAPSLFDILFRGQGVDVMKAN